MYNKIVLLGYVGADSVIVNPSSNNRYLKFSLATSNTWKDKYSGEFITRTEWHKVYVNGKFIDQMVEKIKKGKLVLVEGSLKYFEIKTEEKKNFLPFISANKVKVLNVQSNLQRQANNQNETIEPQESVENDGSLPF